MKRDALLLSEDALVAEARRVLGKFALVKPSISAGGVAAALETQAGHVYTGINLDLACGIGFCAEHSAVAEMLKARETAIRRIVAIDDEGVLAPCGRCRELIVQIDRRVDRARSRIDIHRGRCAAVREERFGAAHRTSMMPIIPWSS